MFDIIYFAKSAFLAHLLRASHPQSAHKLIYSTLLVSAHICSFRFLRRTHITRSCAILLHLHLHTRQKQTSPRGRTHTHTYGEKHIFQLYLMWCVRSLRVGFAFTSNKMDNLGHASKIAVYIHIYIYDILWIITHSWIVILCQTTVVHI